MTREELTEKMKGLPNPPCRINLIQQVWEIMNVETEELDKENGKLEGKLSDLQSEYIELENFHNNIVNGLKAQITKAKDLLLRFMDLKNKPCAIGHSINMLLYENICAEAEQFLKGVKE